MVHHNYHQQQPTYQQKVEINKIQRKGDGPNASPQHNNPRSDRIIIIMDNFDI